MKFLLRKGSCCQCLSEKLSGLLPGAGLFRNELLNERQLKDDTNSLRARLSLPGLIVRFDTVL
jgi:hypothetical protein